MDVPFLDLKAPYQELKAAIDAAIARVLASGWYIGGPETENFERDYAVYCGVRHCIGVGNGLESLAMTLRAAGIGPGDDVLVPSNTFIATWLAVTQVGANPIPVEPALGLYTVEAEQFETALTPATKALLPVHLYGHACHMQPIMDLAAKHALFVLDDAAQAQGAKSGGEHIGSIGHATAWSFYPGKNLGAMGDAGAVTTNDTVLAEILMKLRSYGSTVKYVHDIPGYNSRLDPIQAAVLMEKLPVLDEWNARRQAIADIYSTELRNLPLILPQTASWCTPVWHNYVIRVADRDNVQAFLRDNGVQTLIHYPIPPHQQAAYADRDFSAYDLRRTEAEARELLSLPIGPHMREEHAMHVVQSLRSALGAMPQRRSGAQ